MQTTVKKLFQQGHYDEVLSLTVDAPGMEMGEPMYPWVMGALALVGRNEEAEGFYARFLNARIEDDFTQVATRFFYALSVCRAKRFEESKKLFLDNFRTYKRHLKNCGGTPNDAIAFYSYQGFAFFRFSTGRYVRALDWAKKATAAAASSQDVFSAVLAFELYGHIQCRTGYVHQGLRHINLAVKKANSLGAGAVEHAAKSSLMRYQALFGLKPLADIIAGLKGLIEECQFEESYSRALLRISLAHQYVFKGQLNLANDQLNEAAGYVFQVDNPLLEIKYKICLAEILCQRGQLAQALPLLKEGADKAKSSQHYDLLLACLGFQERIVQELAMDERSSNRNIELIRLTKLSGNAVSKRILSRQQKFDGARRTGEDRLGDLLDAVYYKTDDALQMVFQSGYLIFLKKLLQVDSKEKLIYAGLEDKKLTLFVEGEVHHSRTPYTNFSARFLELLGKGAPLDKEQITMGIWQQSYNPLRHDNLIYNLVNRTRKLLAEHGHWIQHDETGYYLGVGVKIKFRLGSEQYMQSESTGCDSKSSVVIGEELEINNHSSKPLAAQLSFRQNQVFELVKKCGRLQTKDVVKAFSISDATAARDLSALHQSNLVTRVGSGRSTYYTLVN